MSSTDSIIYHFTEDQRSHPVPFLDGSAFDGCQEFAVFIHRDRVYGTSAVSFGQVSSNPKHALQSKNTLRIMEIFGRLCEQASRSPFGRARGDDGKTFARYEAFVREIPYADGRMSPDGKSYLGWILWCRYTYTGDHIENNDLDAEKISDLRKMRERNFVRNPVWALGRALHENAGGRGDPVAGQRFQATPHAEKPKLGVRKRWVDTMTKAQMYDELMFYSGDFDYSYAASCEFHANYNPGNPFNCMSIDKACELAAAAGADCDYLNAMHFRGTEDYPDRGARVWKLRLNECTPNRLLQTFFPDQQRPEWEREIDEEGLGYLHSRYYDNALADEKGIIIARARAEQSVRLNMQRATLSCAQSQSLEGVRARMEAMFERELNQRHDLSFEEQAAIKLSIQRRGCEYKRTVLHPDGNLPNALKALCRGFQETLDNSPNRNFCMPLPRQTKNLSCLGENVAYMMLSLEKTFGVHSLHRECMLLTFCNLHVHCVGSFHPHPMMFGDPMTGKSMGIKFRQMVMVEGTFLVMDHMSAQAFMAADNSGIHHMVILSEEFEPSAVGVNAGSSSSSGDRDGRGASGRDMALTDKASAIRALMTSMELSFSRLVQRADTGEYTRDSHTVKTNVEFAGAMNATGADLAPNSRSRWLIINIQNRPRDTSTVQGKIVGTTGFSKTPEFAKFRRRMQRDQVVVGHIFLMIYMRLLDDINRTVTDAVFVDLLHECVQEGLGGANDIRNFEKTRMLTDVICVCRVVWEYLDSGLPGMKKQDEPFKEDDFLAMGKLLETSVEDLVLAVTLTSDQYEDPVMFQAVEAMNRYFTTGLAQNPQATDSQLFQRDKVADLKEHEQAEKTAKKKAKKAKRNGSGSRAPPLPPEENKEHKDNQINTDNQSTMGVYYGNADRVVDQDGKELPQSAARNEIKRQNEQNYVAVEWYDRTPYMTDPQRCNLLGERIRPLMPSKHSLAAIQSWVRNLYNEVVEDANRPGHTIPTICWPDGGTDSKTRTCLISKKVLQNNKQDRLVSILAGILDKDGMPDLEYITGIPEMRTPFVLMTVVPDHVKLLRALDAESTSPTNFASFLDNGKDEKKVEPPRPRPRKRAKYVIRNQGWVDQAVTLMVRRAITFDMNEDQRDAVLRKSATELFQQPYVEIDCDFEEYGTYRFLSDSRTDFETLRLLGMGDVKSAKQIMIRETRHKLYDQMPTFEVRVVYPDCFHSRDPKFFDKTRWRGEGPPPNESKRFPRDSSEDSLDALHKTRIPSNLSMDISRYKAVVDPHYRDTAEFDAYQQKTHSIHQQTALIHANLLRTQSTGHARPQASEMDQLPVYQPPPDRMEDEDDAALAALEALEGKGEPDGDTEMQVLGNEEETRSGFESSAIAMLWRRPAPSNDSESDNDE